MRDHQNFETIIKNEKRKKWLKMIGTSSIVTVVVGVSLAFGVYTTLTHRMEKQAQQAVRQFNISDFIFSPNVKATTQHYTLTSATRATLTSEREKNIDGYHLVFLGLSPEEKLSQNNGGILKTRELSKKDLDWLKHDLSTNSLPTLVFIHYGLAEDNMVGNWWFEENTEHALLKNLS